MAYDKGAAIRIESQHYSTTPFSTTETLYDPTTVTVTVTDGDGVEVVADQEMTNHTTGQFYYILQTTTSYTHGIYTATITATGPSFNSVEKSTFTLE